VEAARITGFPDLLKSLCRQSQKKEKKEVTKSQNGKGVLRLQVYRLVGWGHGKMEKLRGEENALRGTESPVGRVEGDTFLMMNETHNWESS